MMNKGMRSFLRAVLCLALGLVLCALGLTGMAWLEQSEKNIARAAQTSLEEGLLPLLTGGFREGPLGLLGKAAPTVLLALGVSLAWQAGMLQLGGAGQYALGASAAMLCASLAGLPWYFCLAAAALAGALWGAAPGALKSRFRLREELGTALSAWLALYALQALSPLFNWEQSRQPDLLVPLLAAAGGMALLLWLGLRFTVPGLEIRLLGVSKKTARYAGAETGKTAFRVLCLSGLLGGLAGGMAYLTGGVNQLPDLTLALTGPGLRAVAAAVLANGNPLGTVCAAVIVQSLSLGAETLRGPLFTVEMGETALALILYGCACFALRRGKGGWKA